MNRAATVRPDAIDLPPTVPIDIGRWLTEERED
jgi:hypothetical protein